MIIFVSADFDGESYIGRSGASIFRTPSERKRLKPAGLRALVSTYRINHKAVVAGREPTLHLRGRSSCPAGSRRGNDAERAACRTRCLLAVFLPNKVVTTRILPRMAVLKGFQEEGQDAERWIRTIGPQ